MNDKLKPYALIGVITSIICSLFISNGCLYLFQADDINSKYTILLSIIPVIILTILIIDINNIYPDKTFKEKIALTTNKWIAKIINFIFCFYLIVISTYVLYSSTNLVTTHFLSETPSIFINVLFSFIILYSCKKKTSGAFKVGLILFFCFLIFFLLAAASLVPSFDIGKIKPFDVVGALSFKSVLNYSLICYLPIISILYLPKKSFENENKCNKWIIISIISAFIITFIVFMLTLGNLGIDLSNLYIHPEYIVLKRIKLFKFIDLLNNLLIQEWFFTVFILLNTFVLIISNNNLKKINSNIKNIIILFIIVISCEFFKNNAIYHYFINKFLIKLNIFVLIIFILSYILLKICKKNKKCYNNLQLRGKL